MTLETKVIYVNENFVVINYRYLNILRLLKQLMRVFYYVYNTEPF